MAYIDKLYATKNQYDEFYEWAINHSDMGRTIANELIWYDEWTDKKDYPIANLTTSQDMWLVRNCPITFVLERLEEQYNIAEKVLEVELDKLQKNISVIIVSYEIQLRNDLHFEMYCESGSECLTAKTIDEACQEMDRDYPDWVSDESTKSLYEINHSELAQRIIYPGGVTGIWENY